MTNRPATAPPPAASSSGTFVAGWRATRDHRHGRHTCAAAAPRSKPAQPGEGGQVHEVDAIGAVERTDAGVDRPRAVGVQPEHGDHRRERRRREHHRDGAAAQRQGAQHHEQQRPQQVPLLFHAEAPQVTQQRWIGGPVRHAAGDLAPVAGVEDRPRQVAAQLGALGRRAGDHRPHRRHHQHHEQRREQPARSAQPELREVGAPAAVALVEEQGGDQVARHDEEHLDADEPAVHPREAGVVADDGDHRERAQAVERRLVGHARRPSTSTDPAGRGRLRTGRDRVHGSLSALDTTIRRAVTPARS